MRILQFLIIGAAMALSWVLPANAHGIRPTIVDFEVVDAKTFELSLSANLEALIAEIGAEHNDAEAPPNADEFNRLRELSPEALEARFKIFLPGMLAENIFRFDGKETKLNLARIEIPEIGDINQPRFSKIVLSGAILDGAKTFIWRWPEKYGQSVIRTNYKINEDDSPVGYSMYLDVGEESEPIALSGEALTFSQIFFDYVKVGFTHILPLGLDHILFVVGLFLLSPRLKPLLWQITSFTIAHSVALAFGMLGIINVDPAIVEPLIAASIVYVCVENIFTSHLQRWRPLIVFGFGLLHGLGFAGVLAEIGLAKANFAAGLIAFNVGVELGQLTVIAICFALVGYWFRDKPWYRQRITIPASVVIACIGAYWFYERVFVA